MTSSNLAEVGARLEEAVLRIHDPPTDNEELYERYEMTAISILDSEACLYGDDELYHYLRDYLERKRRQLGLKPID
jgi:hypothetical protein